jgi:nucleotide-binding universal stress UspA family protein
MKLLVPVDGSEASNTALDFVASRMKVEGAFPAADVRLLNVQWPIPPRAARAAGKELVRKYHQLEAESVLKPALKRLADAGVPAQGRFEVGSPAAVVSSAATQGHPDLVVMGNRGHSALGGLVFGSVTQAVLAAGSTPLLVLRAGPVPKGESLRVAVAIDGSRHSLAAVRYVLEHRALFGPAPSFSLLHVESGRTGDPSWDAVVGPAKRLFEKAGLAVEAVRLTGEPAGDVIAKHLGRNRADLLVMGSHGRTPLKSLLLGSVATRVASRCRLPLLLVRPRARSTATR